MVLSTITIGDLGKVITGKTPPTKLKQYWGNDYPFITPKDIKADSYTVVTERYLSAEWKEKSPKYVLPEGATCYVCIGATIGKSCYVDQESFCNQQINAVIPDSERFNPKYVYSLLNTITEKVRTRAGGAATPIVNKTAFSEIKIHVHEKKDQDKIVAILEKYDNLIENNNRRIEILEDMAQSLYREWFVNFRYPGHAGDAKNSNKPILIDSPLGPIPEGWEIKRIKDIGTVNTGKTPSKKKPEYYSSEDIPFLKTPDMHGAIFSVDIADYLSEAGANSQKNKYVPVNSICVSCIGARAGVVTITSKKLQTNQQINSVVLNDEMFREYFYLFAVSLHQKIHALGSSGATMINVNKSKFESIEVIVPPTSIMKAFNLATASSFDLILNLQKRNKNLKKQRDMLLPKLISGDIEL